MVITLLSDFGDAYPASMKGVILSINPMANIVDISHSIPVYDIRAGAFILMTYARYFPEGSVHIAVVDPGVGTKRRPIVIKMKMKTISNLSDHYFIGPDNGILIPAARSLGEFEVYEITNEKLFLKNVSHTFHGRDIFAPVGAHISKGMAAAEAGRQIFDFVDLDFGMPNRMDGLLAGEVIFIDSFGNIITNISSDLVDFQHGDVLEIQDKRISFKESYSFCEEGEPLALIGSHGFLEIAVNRGDAAFEFGMKPSDKIVMKLKK